MFIAVVGLERFVDSGVNSSHDNTARVLALNFLKFKSGGEDKMADIQARMKVRIVALAEAYKYSFR